MSQESQPQAQQQDGAAVKLQRPKGSAIRGCLTGSKLSHLEPLSGVPANVPDVLKVTSIRVIRSQVKALDGHQVEVIGTLRGIPGQENGLLVTDSDSAKVYIGGGDKNIGQDLRTERVEPPTIHANTIKDIAPSCTTPQSK